MLTATVALCCVVGAASSASAASREAASLHAAPVPVVDCPTEFGAEGQRQRTPATVDVISPASTLGLTAYTNTQLYLIGPRGMRCSGIVAADGGSEVAVWPEHHSQPRPHSRTDGLTLSLEPACVSCKAEEACPFFTALARHLGFPCESGVPKDERVYRLRPNLVLFEDPPGVSGSGWPSGGPDPANGLVGYTGNSKTGLVYRSTCTLPASDHSICTTILNDVIRRYG